MRDFILFYVNGQRFQLKGEKVFYPLSRFLRNGLRLTGTKVVCAEGDCGACTVLIGTEQDGKLKYKAVNSCIQYLFQVDSCHIITVEGIREREKLHPVQNSFIKNHGSQCGYCTPGIINTLVARLDGEEKPDREKIKGFLTGNLCRCTGYDSIVESAYQSGNEKSPGLNELFREDLIRADFLAHRGPVDLSIQKSNGSLKSLLIPQNLKQALNLRKKNPAHQLVSGGTDIGVQLNHQKLSADSFMSISRLPEIRDISIDSGLISIGAGVTWDQLETYVKDKIPELYQMLQLFASPQIKSVGTIGGNIANASPVGDSIPFLFIVGAELELRCELGNRWVKISSFYRGYKKMDLKTEELIVKLRFRLPEKDKQIRLYKVSKRKHLDIAIFSAAFSLKIHQGKIADICVALGGVGPTIVRAVKAEEYLQGRQFKLEHFKQAGVIARDNIQPLTDVRGSAAYRKQLTVNIFEKFYHDIRYKKI